MALSFMINITATTEIYTLSLHDALPISDAMDPLYVWFLFIHVAAAFWVAAGIFGSAVVRVHGRRAATLDRKSTRLNSSHSQISYAVFCLKKKNTYYWEHPFPVTKIEPR